MPDKNGFPHGASFGRETSEMRHRENQEMNRERPGRQQNSRPTIGLLTRGVSDEFSTPFWNGVADAAQARDVNLIGFAGGILRSPQGFEAQSNALYNLVGAENVDGLVVWTGILGHYVGPEEMRDFCERYPALPMVSIELPLKGIPSVLGDFHQGMRGVISHLIEVHGHHRIAFIRGPEDSLTGEERYRTYVDVLAEYGIPLDPDLVAPGTFFAPSGAAAMRLLLDERKVDFEAVVAANDNMALDALQALQARGIRVPDDVAVAGLDDIEEAMAVTPPLTTVRVPFYEWGQRGVEILLAQLQGEEVPEVERVPMDLAVRQSCGCVAPAVLQAGVGPVTAIPAQSPAGEGHSALQTASSTGETFEAALAARRGEILSEMAQAAGVPSDDTIFLRGEQLLDAFAAEIGGELPGAFLRTLDEVLRQVADAGGDVAMWQGVLSALRRHALPCFADNKVLSRAEDLWGQARVMTGEVAQRVQVYRGLQAEQQAATVREIGQVLITTFNVAELMDVLARELPRLGIRSFYLSSYEEPGSPDEWSRLILAYNEKGRAELGAGGQRFPARQLVPEGLLPRDRRYSIVVEPLYFREGQLGFALFETGPREEGVCDTLRGVVSSALKGAFLVQQVESRALQLRTAAEVSRAVGSTLDPDRLIQQVVDLARERFDLYYAGLFLVDQTGEWTGEPGTCVPQRGKWAVLRAGTGEAGQQMMAEGHMLEIGGTSMVGWCVANQQARIALDVGTEAVRFDNPWLPETRSEMALPLISRGQVIGALTIQSNREAAFSNEDIAVLQTMADQLANAVANARLYDQAQKDITERKQAEEALAQEQYLLRTFMDNITDSIYFKDTASRFIRINKTQAERFALSDPEQAIGKTDFDFFTEEHARPAHEDEQEVMLSGQPVAKEEKETWPDGRETWVSTVKMPLRNEEGEIVGTFGISREVTERKRVEEEIHRLSQFQESVIDNADVWLDVLDAKANVVIWNKAAEEISGYSREEVVGHDKVWEWLYPDEEYRNQVIAEAVDIIEEGKEEREAETTIRSKDGRTRIISWNSRNLVDENGRPVGSIALGHDITEQKAAKVERERLLTNLERRSTQLQTAAEVSRAATGILDPEHLIQQVVDLARERFDLYYAGLFLVDQTGEWTGEPGKWAVLRAGTGEAGHQMLEAGHKLEAGGESMIGWCVANQQARIALDVGAEAVRFDNPWLPETRSEMALPLISRGQVIGAMTIQSIQSAAFSQEDITVLQTMADQVAVAIENARLLEETRVALTEVEATHRTYLKREWQDYLRQRETLREIGFLYDQAQVTAVPNLWRPEMERALSEGNAVTTQGNDEGGGRTALAIPVVLRGQTVGVLGVEDPAGARNWSEEDRALIESVSQQLALALENARLLEETQRRAARERLAREITDRMRRAADMDTLMQTTIREMADALGKPGAFVQLSMPPADDEGH